MLLSLYAAVVLWHSILMNAFDRQLCVCQKLMYLVISGLLATCPTAFFKRLQSVLFFTLFTIQSHSKLSATVSLQVWFNAESYFQMYGCFTCSAFVFLTALKEGSSNIKQKICFLFSLQCHKCLLGFSSCLFI